jgi:hypothetical protein
VDQHLIQLVQGDPKQAQRIFDPLLTQSGKDRPTDLSVGYFQSRIEPR